MSIFHIPQKKYNKSFADKAVVIIDFIFQFTEEELLSSRWLVLSQELFFLQENCLEEKLQIDLGWILTLPDISCLTLAKIFNLFEDQFFTFKFLHLAINFSFNK